MNHRIFAMWIGCQANCVRKSLTANGFSCQSLKVNEIQTLLRDPTVRIPDPNHWVVRSSPWSKFGPETTDEEAAEITQHSRPGVSVVAWLPLEHRQIAHGIMTAAGRKGPPEFHSILGLACTEWKRMFGKAASVPLAIAESQLCFSDDTGVREIFRELLFQNQSDYARLGGLCKFVDFLRLFLRYGRTDGLRAGLEEITTDRGTLIPGLAVREWIPNLNEHLRNHGSFVIVEGNAPGTFQLIVMAANETVGLEIVVDPSSEQGRFSVMIEGTMTHAPTWKALFETLVKTTVNGVQLSSRIDGRHPLLPLTEGGDRSACIS
jgi:hypothetical protein